MSGRKSRGEICGLYRRKLADGLADEWAAVEAAKECGIGTESLRRYLREEKLAGAPAMPHPQAAQKPLSEIAATVYEAIKTKSRTIIELADQLGVAPKVINAAVDDLRSRHFMIDEFGGGLQLARDVRATEQSLTIEILPEQEIAFGLVGDTHIGSKYERLDVLNALYDRFAAYGIETVYHCGNWIDGECRFNRHDIYVHGFEQQVENFTEKYPRRPNIKTFIVSGDDHEGWYVQREGINVGRRMQQTAWDAGRDDLIDLGYMERNIELQQPGGNQVLRVIHAGGGSAYAISYSDQKYAESLQGGEKPRIVAVGHFHKYNVGYPREIYMVQVGCCQDQTPFMRKKKLQAMVGGVVMWVRQAENGIITSIKHEWIPFYDKKFYAYQWNKEGA